MGLCLAGTALQASGLEQSLRLTSLYSLLVLYFQDFSGKIKSLKNTPHGPGWDDCMMNVSHKVRLMLLWHLWENLVLVFTPTLLLVQCLMPKLNTWFSWLLSEFSVDCSLLQRVPVVCLLFVWHLSEGEHTICVQCLGSRKTWGHYTSWLPLERTHITGAVTRSCVMQRQTALVSTSKQQLFCKGVMQSWKPASNAHQCSRVIDGLQTDWRNLLN